MPVSQCLCELSAVVAVRVRADSQGRCRGLLVQSETSGQCKAVASSTIMNVCSVSLLQIEITVDRPGMTLNSIVPREGLDYVSALYCPARLFDAEALHDAGAGRTTLRLLVGSSAHSYVLACCMRTLLMLSTETRIFVCLCDSYIQVDAMRKYWDSQSLKRIETPPPPLVPASLPTPVTSPLAAPSTPSVHRFPSCTSG